MPTTINPKNLIPAVEKIMAEMDAVQTHFNKVLLQQAEREARLLQQLSAVTEKLNVALANIEELKSKMDGRTTAKTVMRAREAAAYLGLNSLSPIYRKVKDGHLRVIKIRGARYGFQKSDLDAYLNGKFLR